MSSPKQEVRFNVFLPLLLFGWMVLASSIYGQDQESTTNPSVTASQQYKTAIAHLQERAKALRDGYQAIEWPASSAKEVGRSLKEDPQACLSFIRRAMRYEPYEGVLRSSDGALAAGGGNSAELAILLKEMICTDHPALKVRFAIVQLSPEQKKLLAKATLRERPARPVVAAKPTAAAPTAPLAYSRGHGAVADNILSLAEADLNSIQPLLKSLPAAQVGSPDETHHVWLQIQQGEHWVTLDPAGNLALPSVGVQFADNLPSNWQHQVKFTLDVERVAGGKVSRDLLLETKAPASQLQGRPIELMIIPEELAANKMIDSTEVGDSFLEQAKSFEQFNPTLAFGPQEIKKGRTFNLQGKSSAAAAKTTMGLGGFDPFRRAGPGTGTTKSEISGLWLKVTIESPGQRPRVIERSLLDRIGPAARAANEFVIRDEWKDVGRVRVCLFQRHQILIGSGPLCIDQIGRDLLDPLVEGGVLDQALAIQFGQTPSPVSKVVSNLRLPWLPIDLITCQNTPTALAQASLAGEGICFAAAPQVYVRSELLDVRGKNLIQSNNIDIVSNDLCFLSKSNDVQASVLQHGLWASEIEGLMAGHRSRNAVHAAGILREAAKQGIALKLIRKADDFGAITADPDTKALMMADVSRGNALIVPTRAVSMVDASRFAWWRIDPQGQILAIGSDGRGQASEGEMILEHISIPMVKHCMKFVGCFNKGVAAGKQMNSTAAECLSDSIKDVVKESLDGAIDYFGIDPFKREDDEVVSEESKKEGELYAKLLAKAKEAASELGEGEKEGGDLLDKIPGIPEGRHAADTGKEIGNNLGLRIFLLLKMGNEIAAYAAQEK